jgi:Trk K+ transport system NAD-binding subunit
MVREDGAMEVILVGAGETARALLRRLANQRWDVVVVDEDPDGLRAAGTIRPIRPVLGAGSDPDVLAAAGMSRGALVVAATGDDDVNLNVAQAAAGVGASCVAVAADPERLPAYRAVDIPAFSPDRLVARRVVSLLEPRRVFSAGIAGGRAEGLDFRIVSRSPVCGMALRDLEGRDWLVVSVLRKDRLIIPHGDTVLEENDVVTVVGAGADLPEIVSTFTSGVARFPTDFGSRVVVPIDHAGDLEGTVDEAVHVARAGQATGVTFVHRDPSNARKGERARLERLVHHAMSRAEDVDPKPIAVDGDPERFVLRGGVGADAGLIVVAPPVPGRFRWRFRVARLLRAALDLERPLLVARGSHPYGRVVVPARETPAGRAAAGAAIDIAGYEDAQMVAIAVIPPLFMAGDEAREESLRTAARLQEEAALQGVDVRRVVRQGNEVRLISAWAGRGSLVVLGIRRRAPTPLTPGVAGLLLSRLPSSVIVVPHRKRR